MSPRSPRSGRRRGRLERRLRRARERWSTPVKRLYARGVLSTEGLTLPDFLVIGAQKAGTTWLARNLETHPEISMAVRPGLSDPTEVRYFDRNFHRSLRWYARHFRDLPGRLKGDKSPNYYALPPERVRLVGELLPQARVILMLRDPVERAWSHALMNLVTLPGRRFEDVPAERFRAHFRRTRARGEYARVLATWRDAFSRERFRVAFYDDVAERPLELLAGMLEFLGAAPETDWERYPFRRAINRGPGIPVPEEHRRFLAAMFREDLERLRERLGPPVERWLREP